AMTRAAPASLVIASARLRRNSFRKTAMASIQHRLFILVLRLLRRNASLAPPSRFHATIARDRRLGPARLSPRSMQRIAVSHEKLGQQDLYTLAPKIPGTGRHVLYLPGGAYVK